MCKRMVKEDGTRRIFHRSLSHCPAHFSPFLQENGRLSAIHSSKIHHWPLTVRLKTKYIKVCKECIIFFIFFFPTAPSQVTKPPWYSGISCQQVWLHLCLHSYFSLLKDLQWLVVLRPDPFSSVEVSDSSVVLAPQHPFPPLTFWFPFSSSTKFCPLI